MKLKKLLSLLPLSAALAFAGTAQADEVVKLKLAHFLPAVSNAHANILAPWCEQLKEDSNGRLECEIYPSLQLGGTPATLADMARSGAADIVWTAPSYSAGKFPRIEVLELPFLLPYGGLEGNKLIWEYYQNHAQEDFKPYKVLAMFGDGGMDFHVRPKAVESLDDLKGLKLRASSRSAANTLTALGATPVSMPPAQMTESISKGVIDGALAAWEVVPPTKLDEVTNYHSSMEQGKPAIGYTVLTVLMNQKKYDSLPDDLKEILDRHSGDALVERFGTEWDIFTENAKADADPDSIVLISDENYAEMQKATAGLHDEWVKNAPANINAQELLDAAKQILN